MAKYRPLKTSFWTDDWIATLCATEKLLYLYLLTNPHTNLCGIYRVSIRYLSFETGIGVEEVTRILQKFEEDKKAVYKDGWIVLVNYQKHQTKSPKVKKGIEREMSEIPQEIAELRYGIDTVSIGIDKPILKLKPKLKLKKDITNVISKKSEKEIKFEEDSVPYQLAFLMFENIRGAHPKFKQPNFQKWAEDMDKMLRLDGRTQEEISALILWVTQDMFWSKNVLSAKKLREKFDQLWMNARSAVSQAKKNQIPAL